MNNETDSDVSSTQEAGITQPLDYRSLIFRQVDRCLMLRAKVTAGKRESVVIDPSIINGAWTWSVKTLQSLVHPYIDDVFKARHAALMQEHESRTAGGDDDVDHLTLALYYNKIFEEIMDLLHRRNLLLDSPTGERYD